MLLIFALLLAACSSDASLGAQPDALALADEIAATEAVAGPMEMSLLVGQQSFALSTAICNTYDDDTFKFALAEGTVDGGGQVAATIERFDNGVGFEMIIALEGVRDDGIDVSWHAQDSIPVHEINSTLVGTSVHGTALFASIGGPEAAGILANGSFAVSCG